MKPTPKLRFIWRDDKVVLNGEKFDNWRFILQQWWVDEWLDGEWRDVPVEKED